jgi:Zn-dependent M28 family amino/carboxypeptidase
MHAARYRPAHTANVIGELPGTAPSERVVIAAHYDTQLDGVGACDNATGLAALLELARSWSGYSFRRTVVFVALADEEHGCMGAVDYCRRHADSLDTTVGMVNLDALAWGAPAYRALHSDASIAAFARENARRVGWVPDVEVDANSFGSADHRAFIAAGVPACWLWRYPPVDPYYHTRGDTPNRLDFDLVSASATANAAVAFGLAQEPNLAIGRAQSTTLSESPIPGVNDMR